MTDVPGDAPRAAPPDAEERALTDSGQDTPAEPPRVVVPRWIQLVALPLAVLAAWALAKAAGKVLLLFIIAALFFAKEAESYSRVVFFFAPVLSIVLLLISRSTVRYWCAGKPWWGIPTVILGAGKTGQGVLKILRSQPRLGFRPIAILDQYVHQLDLPSDVTRNILVGDLSLSPVFAQMHQSCYAIVTIPGLSSQQLAEVTSEYFGGFSHVLSIPDLFGFSSVWVSARDMGVLRLEVSQMLVHRMPRLIKRALDLAIGGFAAMLLLPLFVILYLAVRLTSKGPVLYGQRRIGQGRVFNHNDVFHVVQAIGIALYARGGRELGTRPAR